MEAYPEIENTTERKPRVIDDIAFKIIAMRFGRRGLPIGIIFCQDNFIFVSLVGISIVLTPMPFQNALRKT